MFRFIAGLGVAYAIYELFFKTEEPGPNGEDTGVDLLGGTRVPPSGGGGAGVTPGVGGELAPECVRDSDEEAWTDYVIGGVLEEPGTTLLARIPKDMSTGQGLAGEINNRRSSMGGDIVFRQFREFDQNQSPRDWLANLAYWYVYPKGPVQIGSPTGGCAAAWKRIRAQVGDRIDAEGI